MHDWSEPQLYGKTVQRLTGYNAVSGVFNPCLGRDRRINRLNDLHDDYVAGTAVLRLEYNIDVKITMDGGSLEEGPMVTIEIANDQAIFEVEARHRLWAFKSRLEIPLAHIIRVYADPEPAMGWFDGFKVVGADLPHYFRAGTFWLHGEWVFFDVHHPENTIIVELQDEHFVKLIVEVADPSAAVKLLQEHLPR